uniref:(northern house mosquito) hypothetical protein n=1 Tax=Culex pipiens TaxID=7175 RepID=A0A8D8C2P7_CULPI
MFVFFLNQQFSKQFSDSTPDIASKNPSPAGSRRRRRQVHTQKSAGSNHRCRTTFRSFGTRPNLSRRRFSNPDRSTCPGDRDESHSEECSHIRRFAEGGSKSRWLKREKVSFSDLKTDFQELQSYWMSD